MLRPKTRSFSFYVGQTALIVGVAVGMIGCYDQIAAAVVDDNHEPGGVVHVQIGDGSPGETTGLASGDPLNITGQNQSLVVALTLGATSTGGAPKAMLAKLGTQIIATIVPMGSNKLQVHVGGQSCVADTGTVQIVSNTDGTISGSFSASGTVADNGAPFALTGTLTAVPFWQ